MAAADKIVRRLAATVASNSYRAHPDAGSARRRPTAVPAELVDGYVAEVDPHGLLDDRERMKRVRAAYRRDVARRELDAVHSALDAAQDGGIAS